jgi:hypothetical protein
MKRHLFFASDSRAFFAACLLTFCGNHVQAQQARDVVSEDALKQQVGTVPPLKTQLTAKAKPLTTKPPAIQSSLWARSIILGDGEKYTLIPVGAILHLPEALRSHVLSKPQGDFTFWPNFLKRNQAWLGAKEVTLTLSRGNAQEANALLKSVSRDPRVLVATYKGGPITILEAAPTGHGTKTSKP